MNETREEARALWLLVSVLFLNSMVGAQGSYEKSWRLVTLTPLTYPQPFINAGMEGRVTVTCRVSKERELSECEPASRNTLKMAVLSKHFIENISSWKMEKSSLGGFNEEDRNNNLVTLSVVYIIVGSCSSREVCEPTITMHGCCSWVVSGYRLPVEIYYSTPP